MKKFDALKMVTDEQKFSELVFDLISECKTAEKLTDLLREELPEKATDNEVHSSIGLSVIFRQ